MFTSNKLNKCLLFILIHQNKQLAYHNLLKLGMPFLTIVMEITWLMAYMIAQLENWLIAWMISLNQLHNHVVTNAIYDYKCNHLCNHIWHILV
jgi:hypothetical protein